MRSQLLLLMLIGLIGSFSACKRRTTPDISQVKEAFDDVNAPNVFGVAETLHLQDLKRQDASWGMLKSQPWSDTYWPLDEAGLAARWIDTTKAPKIHSKFPMYDQKDYEDRVRDVIKTTLQETKKVVDEWQTKTLYFSPAEKYDIALSDYNFGLTQAELISYAQNYKYYEENEIPWGWMGHCHGWAPASFLFDMPKLGVLWTNNEGKKVFFTPGDIRGLLTKGAADNSFDSEVAYMGSRCNQAEKKLTKDKRGRIVDGMLGLMDSNKGFAHNKPIKIHQNNWFGHDELVTQGIELIFQFGPSYSFSTNYWLEATQWVDKDANIVGVNIYTTKKGAKGLEKHRLIASDKYPHMLGCTIDSENNCVAGSDDAAFVREREKAILFDVFGRTKEADAPQNFLQNYVHFKYQKDCRDLNAGAFHVILAKYLSTAGAQGQPPHSFVLDVTRDDQVWNHAIYRFDAKIGEKTPIKVGSLRDPYQYWRAKGTTHIVDVYTRMIYAVENGPFVKAARQDDALSFKVYHYTLDLNEREEIIGGEWHGYVARDRVPTNYKLPLEGFHDFSPSLKPESGEDLLKSLNKLVSSKTLSKLEWKEKVDAPDFIWMHRKGTNLGQGKINQRFIQQLHACSVNEQLAKQQLNVGQSGRWGGKKSYLVDYVECQSNTQLPE